MPVSFGTENLHMFSLFTIRGHPIRIRLHWLNCLGSRIADLHKTWDKYSMHLSWIPSEYSYKSDYLPPTKEKVNVFPHVCLSGCRNQITFISYRLRNCAALPRLPASCAATRNFTSGKIPRICIGGAPLELAVVLRWFYSLNRRKTFVRGKCALPSALLVVIFTIQLFCCCLCQPANVVTARLIQCHEIEMLCVY